MGAPISFEFAAHVLPFRAKMTETKTTKGADMTIGSKNKLPMSQNKPRPPWLSLETKKSDLENLRFSFEVINMKARCAGLSANQTQ